MQKSKKGFLSLLIALAAALMMAAPTYALDNVQSINGEAIVQNSAIIEGIENAIEDAKNSQSGYAQDDATSIIGSADGHALIPWKTIEEEGRIQDIDELRRRCGEDLILIQNENNKIKFVGGKFSNVKVTDETSAIKALDTMANLYDNGDDRRYLKLSATGTDSLGNPFYRFVSVDKETEDVNSDYTVTLSVDTEGNVLGASNSDSSSQWENPLIKKALQDKWGAEQDLYENSINGYIKLYPEPRQVYDDETKAYYWALYYEKNGIVHEVLVSTLTGDKVAFTKKYDAESFHKDPSSSFNGDYEFKNLNNPTEKTFIDFYGNKVTLPVAYMEGKGWYIVDTSRNMICVESSKNSKAASDASEKHFFGDDYFDAVNAYIYDGTTSDLLYDEGTLISAFTTLQQSYDESKLMGVLPKPTTIYVDFVYDDYGDNASQQTYNGIITFKVNNNAGNADYAGIAHEFGHTVVANHGQNVFYQAATGAINESYADIIGNLLKLIKKKEGTYAGNVNFERWLIGEFLGDDTEHVIRDMSNPMNNGHGKYPSPSKINDQYFVRDTGVYNEDTDNGGVHQNNSVLSNICYRMYNEVFAEKDQNGNGIPDENRYRDLLKVWYDSVIYINQDSKYSDIKGYVLQAMKNHGYPQDMIRQSEQIFNDANVDDYKPFTANSSKDNVYDQSDLAVAAKVNSASAGLDGLYNLVEGKVNAEGVKYDYEIAYDEYKLALLQGLTGDELKEYENRLEIAYNSLVLSNNNVEELENAFSASQDRLKKMVDDKMAIVKAQEKELKKVAEEKEANPNLERAYRALRRGLKKNINDVDSIVDAIEEAAKEFYEFDEISDVFSETWGIDDDDFYADETSFSEEELENFYIGIEDYPEELDAWDYYDYWDDFWDAYFEDDYDDWYGNYQEWDEEYNYYDEDYSDEDYFSDWYWDDYDDNDYWYPDEDVDMEDAVG